MNKVFRAQQKGVTLIELMVVVAIVGLIAAIGYPSYLSHVEKTRRNLAAADLLELSQWMERRHATAFDYRSGGNAPVLPFTTSPRNANEATAYNLSFDGAVGQSSFVLQAVPTNIQSGDKCGTLKVNHQGTRTATVENCW